MQLNQIETIRKENHEKWLQKNQERFKQFLTDFNQVHTSVVEYQQTFFERLLKVEHSETLQSNLKALKNKAIALNLDQDITQSIGRCLSHVNDIIDNISMPSVSLYQNHVLRISALFEILLMDLTQSKPLPIDELPNDISRQIFKLFDMTTLASATSVSKKWYQQGNEEYYWKQKLQGFPNLVQNNNNLSSKEIYKNIYSLAQQLKNLPNDEFADKAKDQINIFDMCGHFEKLATKLTPQDIFNLINTHANNHTKSVSIFLCSPIIRAKLKQFIKENPDAASADIVGILSNFVPGNKDQAGIAITLYLLDPDNLNGVCLSFPDLDVFYSKILDAPEVLRLFSSIDLLTLIYNAKTSGKGLWEKLMLSIGSDFNILKALDDSYLYLSEIDSNPEIALTVLKKSEFLLAVNKKIVDSLDLRMFAKLNLKYCLAILESPILFERVTALKLSAILGKHLNQLTDTEFEITFEKILKSRFIGQLSLFSILDRACNVEYRIKQVLDDPCVINRLNQDQLDIIISRFKIQHSAANPIHIKEGRLVIDTEKFDPDNNNVIARIR